MFSFLNRSNKSLGPNKSDGPNTAEMNGNVNEAAQAEIEDAKKNLYDAINLKRTDIVVSIINEWFKKYKNAEESLRLFFNSNYCENATSSPLLVAYRLGDKDLVRALLNFGADASLRDIKQKKCLIELVHSEEGNNNNKNNEAMLQLLGDSFMQSLVQNNLLSVRQFLRGGLDLNATATRLNMPDQNSYLHWACMYSSEAVVRLLLESGASVRAVNKYSATPLHECLAIRAKAPAHKEETLRIIELLLVHKSDAVHAKGTGGIYKDLAPLDLAYSRFASDPEYYNLIRDFLSDTTSLTSSSSSVPSSPQHHQTAAELPTYIAQKLNQTALSEQSLLSLSSGSIEQTTASKSPPPARLTSIDHDPFQNWFASDLLTGGVELSGYNGRTTTTPSASKELLGSLLWPQPQSCVIISEEAVDRFYLPNVKSQPLYIYFKPPYTYAYMDLVNKLASAFSGIVFYCIHMPLTSGQYVCVNIDRNLFLQEHAYSIVVTHTKVEINAMDSVSLQYAFFTFMQMCKIYSRQSIPSLRIIDYPNVKYRSVLIDFSQGFYFKYENLLALLQMLAFYKLNQVHFYAKFSSLPPASTKRQWYHFIQNWFGLMKFCEEVNLEIVPSIDIANDVAELGDVAGPIKEYLDLFKGFKYINIGPRLSSMLTCMENKNPFGLDSTQYMMLCSYLYHSADEETAAELDKFDKYILMEYGLKSGVDFGAKSASLYRSGRPFFFCIGSANWNSLMGCPDGSLHNLYDAVRRQPADQPLGFLLCNFAGALNKNPFAFNLNSIIMFAGATWNTKTPMDEVKKVLGDVMVSHGLINDKDGELAKVMFELGHIETYLTRKAVNAKDFSDLPYDEGSLFTRIITNPDDIDLDTLDKNIFKLRAQQSKLKSLLAAEPINNLFREVAVSAEICLHLFKFFILMYNTGTRQQQKAVGLNVINVGVSNLNQTVRTDLANKLLVLKDQYREALERIYYSESIDEYMNNYFAKLIDKLLIDQDESNLVDLAYIKQNARQENEGKKLRSYSTSSSSQTNYYMNQSNDENELLFKK